MTPPPPLAAGLAPDDFSSLESFAAHIQELVLHLRDEGHVLSSLDQHYIERWWAAGYPLEIVLAAILESGRRLMARKSAPRGLPLKRLDKAVVKAGEAAPAAPVFDAETDGGLAARLLERLDGAPPSPSTDAARRRARRALEALRGAGAGAFAGCLAVSRRYYDDVLAGLSRADAERLRQEVLDGLGDGAARMAPDALAETVEELARRRLRLQDSLLDPTDWVV